MTSGYFIRLKGQPLLELSKDKINTHKASLNAGISPHTGYRYFSDKAKELKLLDLEGFTTIMIDGLGLAPEEFMGLRLSDLFILIQKGANAE